MRVLQLAPLWFPVAQNAPGGIESFLAQLIPALARRGCEVTLIACGDSRTPATLVSAVPTGLVDAMRAGTVWEYTYHEQHLLRLALERAADFDVVHSHIGPAAYLLSGAPGLGERVLHTLHTPVTPDMAGFFACHPDSWLSTVSHYQASMLGSVMRCAVIPNGIATDEFSLGEGGGEGLLFIGRIEAVKGPDLAVQVALTLGMSLTLAGPIVEDKLFRQAIEPYLCDRIRYVGVADHRRKVELFGQARCAILPFQREEPFGLTVVEAMACGTPVVSFARGALPEIIESGLTGYLVNDDRELGAAVLAAMKLDRPAIRARAVKCFDIAAVAEAYHKLYSRIAEVADNQSSRLPRPTTEARQV